MAYQSYAVTRIADLSLGATANAPTGVAAGDLLVAFISCDSVSATLTITFTGWTLLAKEWSVLPDGQAIFVYTRIATGTDPYTLSSNDSTVQSDMVIGRWSGRASTLPNAYIYTGSGVSGTSPLTLSVPSLSVDGGDDVAVFSAIDQTAQTDAWGTFSTITGFSNTVTDTDLNWNSINLQTKDGYAEGSTGALSWTATQTAGTSAAGWRAIIVAFQSGLITVEPAAQTTVAVTSTATFSVTASGTPTYQWQSGSNSSIYTDAYPTWANISGATSSSYTTGTLSSTDNGGWYRCNVTSSGITVNSLPSRLFLTGLGVTGKATAGTEITDLTGWVIAFRNKRRYPDMLLRKWQSPENSASSSPSATVYSDWFWPSTGVSVNTTPTGVSATGAPGTVAITLAPNIGVTGVSATGIVGTVTVAVGAAVDLTGVVGTGGVGTATVNISGDVTQHVTGVSASSVAGTVAISLAPNVAVSGIVGTGSVGTVTSTISVSPSVTGVFGAGDVGTAVASISVSPSTTGVFGAGAIGTVVVSTSVAVAPAGVGGTGVVGTVSVATSSNITQTVTGVSSTGAVGTAAVVIAANVTQTVSGVAGTGGVGTVTVDLAENVTQHVAGVSSSGGVGTVGVVVSAEIPTLGVQAAGIIGTAAITQSVTVSVTGVDATGAIGDLAVALGMDVQVSGVVAVGGAGALSTTISVIVGLNGVFATGEVGTVAVMWIPVQTPQNPNWGPIGADTVAGWNPIGTAQSPDWSSATPVLQAAITAAYAEAGFAMGGFAGGVIYAVPQPVVYWTPVDTTVPNTWAKVIN